MTLNIKELGKIIKFAERLKVPFRSDSVMHSCLSGSKKPFAFSLLSEDIAKLSTKYQKLEEGSVMDRKTNWLKKKQSIYQTCGAGFNFFSIDPYGRLKACMLSGYPGYNVLERGVAFGWDKYFSKDKAFKVNLKRKNCFDCKLISFCDICPGWWQEKNGQDRFKPQDYLCNIAKLRYKQAQLSNNRKTNGR
jgi:radical SAM protein with 4Fe4S-binding SPASM domain